MRESALAEHATKQSDTYGLICSYTLHSGQPASPMARTTHTENSLYAPVQAEGGSDSDFCLTRPYTHSILLFTTSSRMSSAPLSTGGSPCKASKPKLSHSIELRGGVVSTHRKPPEVRICRLRNQSVVGTRPPSTSTPHWPACFARR